MEKKQDNWKKIIAILFILFLCIFSIFGIMVLFLKTDMPLTVVSSESMVPNYYPGDLLLVEHVDEGEIIPLDLIVFWPITWGPERTMIPMVPIVHRVIGIERNTNYSLYKGTWYQTKGDFFNLLDLLQNTSLFNDPKIPHFCIIGKVTGRIPLLGLPRLWIDEMGGNIIIYFMLIVLIMLLIYSFLPKDENQNNEKKKPTKKLS